MKARSIITLALLTGCNYDYSLLGGQEQPVAHTTDTGVPPAPDLDVDAPVAEEQDQGEEETQEPVDEGTGTVEEFDSDVGTLETTDEGDSDTPVDAGLVEEPPPEEPPVDTGVTEEPPPDEPPPVVCDADGDGWDGAHCGGSDCDDGNLNIHPLAGDSYFDDVDTDCDALKCNAQYVSGVYIAACISDEGTSQESATGMCTAGGHDGLASLTTAEEYTGALSLRPVSVGHAQGKYRIGLTAAGDHEPFYWDAGAEPPSSLWAPDQPSWTHMGQPELCTVIYPSDMPAYLGPNKLNDEFCWAFNGEAKGFICETREE
jgi:hypothetical protein